MVPAATKSTAATAIMKGTSRPYAFFSSAVIARILTPESAQSEENARREAGSVAKELRTFSETELTPS